LTLYVTGIPEFKAGTAFWNAPKRFEDQCLIVEPEEDGDTYFLGEEPFGNKLYIRDCYERMTKVIAGLNNNRVVITGPPGLGKSTYGFLLAALASMSMPLEPQPQVLQTFLQENHLSMSDEDMQQVMEIIQLYSGKFYNSIGETDVPNDSCRI